MGTSQYSTASRRVESGPSPDSALTFCIWDRNRPDFRTSGLTEDAAVGIELFTDIQVILQHPLGEELIRCGYVHME